MIEWLYEAGIGEARAALVEDGHILAAAIEPDDVGLRVGTVARARLVERIGTRARVTLVDGIDAMLASVPPKLTQGAALTVRVTREAVAEPGRAKPPIAVATDEAPASGPTLLQRIAADGHPVRHLLAHQPDALEAAGWSELLDEAMTGEIAFPGGTLLCSPTPAMTLFDVDGGGPLEALALAAARAVTQSILRHGIGGSIGIDFPTLPGKGPRQTVAAVIDAGLPQPFERTAVNGFGFLQIVRPRPRASLPELLRADPVGAAARAALRGIERTPPGGPRRHRLRSTVVALLDQRPDWIAELARRTGVVHQWDR